MERSKIDKRWLIVLIGLFILLSSCSPQYFGSHTPREVALIFN